MDTTKFSMGLLLVSLEDITGKQRAKARRGLLSMGFVPLTKGKKGIMARPCVPRSLKPSGGGPVKDWADTLKKLGAKFWFACRAAWERSFLLHGAGDARAELPPTMPGGKIMIIAENGYSIIAQDFSKIGDVIRPIADKCKGAVRAIILA